MPLFHADLTNADIDAMYEVHMRANDDVAATAMSLARGGASPDEVRAFIAFANAGDIDAAHDAVVAPDDTCDACDECDGICDDHIGVVADRRVADRRVVADRRTRDLIAECDRRGLLDRA